MIFEQIFIPTWTSVFLLCKCGYWTESLLLNHGWLTLKSSVKSTRESFLHRRIPANKGKMSERIIQLAFCNSQWYNWLQKGTPMLVKTIQWKVGEWNICTVTTYYSTDCLLIAMAQMDLCSGQIWLSCLNWIVIKIETHRHYGSTNVIYVWNILAKMLNLNLSEPLDKKQIPSVLGHRTHRILGVPFWEKEYKIWCKSEQLCRMRK